MHFSFTLFLIASFEIFNNDKVLIIKTWKDFTPNKDYWGGLFDLYTPNYINSLLYF